MGNKTVTGGVDTWIGAVAPSASHPQGNNLLIQDATAGDARALVYLKAPAPVTAGTNVNSATLVLHSKFASQNNITLKAHALGENWKAGKANWNNQPGLKDSGIIALPITATVTTATQRDTLVEFDVTTHMQAVADGASWFGWRITMETAGGLLNVFSSEAGADWRQPRLVVDYSDAPAPPTDLSPSGGNFITVAKPVLRYTFLDYGGNTDLVAQHVQIEALDEFGEPTGNVWDSGELSTSVAELDLSTTDYPGLAANAAARWRVKTEDGSGRWSEYSDWASFEQLDKGSLTINNPSPSPNNFVKENTPPITWTHSGAWAQEAYQVIIQQKSLVAWVNIYNSRKQPGNDDSLTLPKGVLTRANWSSDPGGSDWQVKTDYRVIVRTWDGQGRQGTPGDPAYYQAMQEFTVKEGAASKVTNLAAAHDYPWPWVDLTWSMTTAPDKFMIVRGARIVDTVTPDEVDLGGGNYRFRDKWATLNREHTWAVLPIVNGEMAPLSGSTVTATINLDGIWLVDPDRTQRDAVFIGGLPDADLEMTMEDQGEDYELIGRSSPVHVTNSLGGAKGTVSGVLTKHKALPNIDAVEWRDRLLEFKAQPGARLVLLSMDWALPVRLKDVSVAPHQIRGVIEASFGYTQANEPSYID